MPPDQTAVLLGAIEVPLILIGGDERIKCMNPAAEELFGQAGTGRNFVTVLRQPALLDCVEAAFKTGRPTAGRFLTRDGARDATYQLHAAPVRLDGQDSVMLSLEDITHVEAASTMRRDFVANVSHELRTPLTALMAFIDTLQGPARDDAAAQERFLAIMAREAGRMNRLIGDLLSLSRVEAQERVRPKNPIDLAPLVAQAVATLGPLAQENGVTMTLTGSEQALEILGDSDQILQILGNLLENAIKYGGKNAWIDLERQDLDPTLRVPAARIEVRDDGDGIDPLHLPRLSERFYRVESHRSRERGGTGLGLAIVKHIVNRHRGRLCIESTPGQGSTFIVVLPCADRHTAP